jgi:hypothetical protein
LTTRLSSVFYKYWSKKLLADIFALKNFAQIKNLNQNIMKMGRVACVKMDNILDSLCLITREVKITLPMSNGNMEEPIIYPSKFLLDFLANYNPETTILDVKSAGLALLFLIIRRAL